MGCGSSTATSTSTSTTSGVIKIDTKADFDHALQQAGDKLVAVDFTASWCPPCRRIGPIFDKMAGENPDVSFLKIDVDKNKETAEACKINCMPTFQFYRQAQKVDAFEGADEAKLKAMVKKLKPKAPTIPTPTIINPQVANKSPQVAKLLGDTFITASGKTVGKEALANKIVGIYFSAHWCPPCRGFTPQLIKTYKALQSQAAKNGKEFEIVFCSSDRDQSSFEEYHKEMPWLALPFADRQRKAELCKVFGVSGIPALIMVDVDGTVINDKARGAVGNDPSGENFPWR